MNPRLNRLLRYFIITFAVFFLTPGKPLWWDEFLYFTLAGYPSAGEAWAAFRASHAWNNLQMGPQAMATYFLLKTFGASTIIARLPSLFWAICALFGLTHFAKNRKTSAAALIAASLYLFCNIWWAGQINEARPYMALSAVTICSMAWAASIRLPSWGGYFCALVIALGACWHPFSIFACGISLAYAFTLVGREALTFRFLSPYLFAAFPYLYFFWATWGRVSKDFKYDPLQYIPKDSSVLKVFLRSHLESFGMLKVPVFFAWLASLIIWKRFRESLIIFALALASSGLIVLLAFKSHFLILPRYWIIGYSLTAIAVLLSVETIQAQLKGRTRTLLWVSLIALYSTFGAKYLLQNAREWVNRNDPAKNYAEWIQHCQEPTLSQIEPHGRMAWVDAANQNIRCGGQVWPIFAEFYKRN